MNKTLSKSWFLLLPILGIFVASCEKDIRNIARVPDSPQELGPVVINPVDINQQGFDLLQNMQGYWVGTNRVIADDYTWFAFDYRPISPSHVHGIFEGGTMGNLFTSFFVADYEGTRTILARNGGVLNGIYRTSYFVLDSVHYSANESFYRLVDAKGGTRVMWMELKFTPDSLFFNAYTSRLGLFAVPTRHMTFKGSNHDLSLAQTAANAVGFPQNTPAWSLSNGFIESDFYANAGDTAKSASFLWQGSQDVAVLGGLAKDPIIISDYPHVSRLQVDITRNATIQNDELFVYLSKDPLTDNFGYFDMNGFGTVTLFPQVSGTVNQFEFTYLHPGDYYVTVIADNNGDGTISAGDITHVSQQITVAPGSQQQITINNITVQN